MPPKGTWQLFANSRCEVGEGPRWNDADNMLYWVDIPKGVLYRKSVDTPSDAFECFSPKVGKIGAFTFYQDRLMLFSEGCRVWTCKFGEVPELFASLSGHETTRFNDVFPDDAGHIFCGVAWVPEKGIAGELWRFSPEDKTFSLLGQGFDGMPNGMGVSPDRKTFYFVVSEEYKLYAFSFDEARGVLGNRRVLIHFPANMGNPDGISVDQQTGEIAIAFWDGNRLAIFTPDGELKQEYLFPVKKITSAVYTPQGLFITTGNRPWDDEEFYQNHAGCVWQQKENCTTHKNIKNRRKK